MKPGLFDFWNYPYFYSKNNPMKTDEKPRFGTLFESEEVKQKPLTLAERARIGAEVLSRQPPVSFEEAKEQVERIRARRGENTKKRRG